MKKIKCPACYGDITVEDNAISAICKYCDSKISLIKSDTPRKPITDSTRYIFDKKSVKETAKVIRCKECGADLEVLSSSFELVCEFCGGKIKL